jgi:hypothetical protein
VIKWLFLVDKFMAILILLFYEMREMVFVGRISIAPSDEGIILTSNVGWRSLSDLRASQITLLKMDAD